MSIKTILSNRLRSALSMLGIVIGVLTIMLVVAIGKGAQVSIEEQYKNLSVTSIMVMPTDTADGRSKLSEEDVDFILDNTQYVLEATPILQGKLPVSTTEDSEQFTILGVQNDFLNVSNLELIAGRNFSDDEYKNRGKVIILGHGVLVDLFGGDIDVIGDTVVIGKKEYEIVGVFEPSGASIGPISYDDSVFIPYDTAYKVTLGANATIRLITLATEVDTISLAMDELSDVLRKSHMLKASSPDDFKLRDQGSKVIAAQESAKTMSVLLITVAIIVLVVSGIGIMNVMFAGVAERTKEIGILKSIGAKRSDILNQFLIESIILTLIAGLFGILLGEIIIPFANGIEDMMLIRSNYGDILAFMFALLVGIFFGWYPAYVASKLDPVDAMRL